jgi:hypothetical protein
MRIDVEAALSPQATWPASFVDRLKLDDSRIMRSRMTASAPLPPCPIRSAT